MRILRHTGMRPLVTLATLVLVGASAGTSHSSGGGAPLFGTDGSLGNLIAIDANSGVGTVVGPMGVGPVPSLAIEPETGIMYAGGGAGLPNLYTVDPATGAATFVGDSGLGFAAIGALDFRRKDLFAAVNLAGDGGTGSDHLARIDKTNGAATVIGPFGTCTGVTVPAGGFGSCSIEGIEAIAFDKRGRLWAALSARGAAGTPGLYRVDISTGAASFVAPIVEHDTGLPASGGVVSLEFRGHNLFGGTATALGAATDGGMLIEIDPDDGKFEFVGSVSATGGSSLAALAF
jgi:hypothetical protein